MDTATTDRQLLDTLYGLIDDPTASVDRKWVDAMEERYPCFTLPAVLALQRAADMPASERETMMENLALRATDKESFLAAVDADEAAISRFYPEVRPEPQMTTDNVIDTFLERYGSSSPEEDALLEKLIFNPVAEYAGVLQADDRAMAAPADDQDRMIDAFLAKSTADGSMADTLEVEAVHPNEPSETAEAAPDGVEEARADAAGEVHPASATPGLLSESLAKIFIKQRRYSKAYEILLNLSLNYPEKSIYFADQLRFLRKLIINQQQTQKEQI